MKNLTFITILFLFIISNVSGQFVSSRILISGLTCSMCSKGVESELKKLDFVKSVSMELNSNIANIDFEPGKIVRIKDLVGKVLDGGFSISEFYASFNFENFSFSEGSTLKYNGENFIFIGIKKEQKIDNLREIKFLGKNYQNIKNFKLWKRRIETFPKVENSTYFVTL